MSPEEFRILASLAGFLGLGSFVLIGLKMLLSHRARRLPNAAEDMRALREDVQALRDEVLTLRGDLTDMGERMDFTERVLARSRDAEPGKLPGSP